MLTTPRTVTVDNGIGGVSNRMETTDEILRARRLENLCLTRLRQPRHGAQRQAHV